MDLRSLVVLCYLISSLNWTAVIVVNSEHLVCGILQYSACFLCCLLLKIRYITLPVYRDEVAQNLLSMGP